MTEEQHEFKYHGKIITGDIIRHFKKRNLYRITKFQRLTGLSYTTITIIPRKDKE